MCLACGTGDKNGPEALRLPGRFPTESRSEGFAPELQGVYIEEDEDGRQVAWANVLTHERETELLGKAL